MKNLRSLEETKCSTIVHLSPKALFPGLGQLEALAEAMEVYRAW